MRTLFQTDLPVRRPPNRQSLNRAKSDEDRPEGRQPLRDARCTAPSEPPMVPTQRGVPAGERGLGRCASERPVFSAKFEVAF